MELGAGENRLSVKGEGVTTFRYREGDYMKLFRVYVDGKLFYHPSFFSSCHHSGTGKKDAKTLTV